MNDRYKQLAEQAGIEFWEISGDVDWRLANKENLQEFAQLIVAECLSFVQAGNATAVATAIEEHFGVER